jgi:hypothetical protein
MFPVNQDDTVYRRLQSRYRGFVSKRKNKIISYFRHRYMYEHRFNMFISADVHPWGDFSLLTAPPPTTSGVKSH